jgi:hypothetical protein
MFETITQSVAQTLLCHIQYLTSLKEAAKNLDFKSYFR